jgi:hypothetical protein
MPLFDSNVSRYNRNSSYQVRERRNGRSPGKCIEWTPKDMDVLLDLYFDGHSTAHICRVLQRTTRSVIVRRSKLLTFAIGEYTSQRKTRTGPWSTREKSFANANANKMPLKTISNRLGRSLDDVRDYIRGNKCQSKGFGI